jgi:hypothetical protein
VSVPSFSGPTGAPTKGGNTLDIVDARVFMGYYRDERVVTAHNVWNGSKNVARWYQIDTHGWPITQGVPFTLLQAGEIDPGGENHTFFPAVAENARGDIAVVFGNSAATKRPAVKIVSRKASDPAGETGGLTTLVNSTANAGGRWGDYFEMCIDPVDDRTFWCVGEYQIGGGANWGTWIASLTITGDPGDTNCDGAINSLDIEPFTLALLDPAQYAVDYPDCDVLSADINDDGTVNALDIEPFVNLLVP